jgi:hypothetical protein
VKLWGWRVEHDGDDVGNDADSYLRAEETWNIPSKLRHRPITFEVVLLGCDVILWQDPLRWFRHEMRNRIGWISHSSSCPFYPLRLSEREIETLSPSLYHIYFTLSPFCLSLIPFYQSFGFDWPTTCFLLRAHRRLVSVSVKRSFGSR